MYEFRQLTKNQFEIYEKASEQVILSFDNEKQARNIYRKLKRGCGFNGWTPTFFTKTVV